MKVQLYLLFIILWASHGMSASAGNERCLNFNQDWKFHLGEVPGFMSSEFNDQSWQLLQLPHDWAISGTYDEQNPAGESGAFLKNGIGCYRKSFELPEALNGKRISVRFDGVYMNSTVYINGTYLGNRPYGFSTFEYDLTPYLKYGTEKNVIAVKVDHSLEPSSRWYSGSGINRNVYLLVKPQQHFKSNGIFFRTVSLSDNGANAKIDVDIVSNNYTESQVANFQPKPGDIKRIVNPAHLVSSLISSDGQLIASAEQYFSLSDYTSEHISLDMKVDRPSLWSPQNPYLYRLRTQLIIDGSVIDEEIIPVGIRQIEFNTVNGMLLNGKKNIIKGVCLHKDAGSFGTAVPKDVWRYRLRKLKEMGCNAVRVHGPSDPVFIDVCDELGFLMMAEAFDEWNTTWQWGLSENPEGKRPYSYHLFFNQWAETDLKDMVCRDRNHPSLFIYSVGNEVPDQRIPDGTVKLSRLKSWVKEVDSTRPVVAACDWAPFANQSGFLDTMDLAGYNYIDRYFTNLYADEHQTHPNRIYLGTETYPNLKNWLAVRDNQYVTGEFLWVGIDYMGEAIKWPRKGWEWGLLDIAGFEKPTYYIRQSYWSEKPMVHIAVNLKEKYNFQWNCYDVASHWNFSANETDSVFVYSNCDEVELFLNNKSLGRKQVDKDTYCTLYRVGYKPGILRAEGRLHSKVVANHILRTASDPFQLQMLPDKPVLKQLADELLFIPVEVVDAKGVRCPHALNSVHVEVEGVGILVGLDSGNQSSHERYKSDRRNAFEGRVLATIKPVGPGTIRIKASSDGLISAQKEITVE